MKFSKEQIDCIKNASDHANYLLEGGRGYGKTHKLIKEMEDRINKLEKENQQLKKQKEDVVEYIKSHTENIDRGRYYEDYVETYDLLRMLGEIDE